MIGKGLRLCLRQSEKAVIHFDFFYKKKKKYKHICKHILGQSRQSYRKKITGLMVQSIWTLCGSIFYWCPSFHPQSSYMLIG